MLKPLKSAAPLFAILILATASSARATVESATFSITNDAHRVVECTLLVDGHTWTYLKVHIGKTYSDRFRSNQDLMLVCVRGQKDVYDHLKPGTDYRFIDAPANRVEVVQAKAP